MGKVIGLPMRVAEIAGVTRSKLGTRCIREYSLEIPCSHTDHDQSFDPYNNVTEAQRKLVLGGVFRVSLLLVCCT